MLRRKSLPEQERRAAAPAVAHKNKQRNDNPPSKVVNLSSRSDDDGGRNAPKPVPSKQGKKGTHTNKPIYIVDDHDYDGVQVIMNSSRVKKDKISYKGDCSNSKKKVDYFLCEICADKKPETEKFKISGCRHSYCSDCISKYIETKLEENISNIPCPAMNCDYGKLELENCISILPKKVYNRWGDVLCEALILGDNKQNYCYCPFKDCSSLLIDEVKIMEGTNYYYSSSGEEKKRKRSEEEEEKDMIGGTEAECPYCHRLFCVKCRVPWHSDISCYDFKKLKKDERQREDILLFNLAKKKNWMRCPKCQFYVEKSDGCLYMKCRCKHAFCYHCGAEMTGDLHYCYNCKH